MANLDSVWGGGGETPDYDQQRTTILTKGDVSNIRSSQSVRALKFLWWLCVAEEDLWGHLATSTTFLELLHEHLPNNDIIVVREYH